MEDPQELLMTCQTKKFIGSVLLTGPHKMLLALGRSAERGRLVCWGPNLMTQ